MSQQEQLDTLAEQNRLLRDALVDTFYFLERHSNRWDGVNGKHPFAVVEAAREALALHDLSTSILNQRDARVREEMLDLLKFHLGSLYSRFRTAVGEMAAEKEKQ